MTNKPNKPNEFDPVAVIIAIGALYFGLLALALGQYSSVISVDQIRIPMSYVFGGAGALGATYVLLHRAYLFITGRR